MPICHIKITPESRAPSLRSLGSPLTFEVDGDDEHTLTLDHLAMSYPPGFGAAPPGFASQPNGNANSAMDGDFFGQLSQDEIAKKARKWRAGQKRRFNEKRRTGGGAGIDFGKAVSLGGTGRSVLLVVRTQGECGTLIGRFSGGHSDGRCGGVGEVEADDV